MYRFLTVTAIWFFSIGCSNEKKCQNKWVKILDSSEAYVLYRSNNSTSNYYLTLDSFENHLQFRMYRSEVNDSTNILVSTINSPATTKMESKKTFIVSGHSYPVYRFIVDNEQSFDEEMVFLWNIDLGLFLFGNAHNGIMYKLTTCSKDQNQVINELIDKAK